MPDKLESVTYLSNFGDEEGELFAIVPGTIHPAWKTVQRSFIVETAFSSTEAPKMNVYPYLRNLR